MKSTPTLCTLVPTASLAKAFGVSNRTVERWAKAGIVPSLRAGRNLLFDPSAVAAALTGQDDER